MVCDFDGGTAIVPWSLVGVILHFMHSSLLSRALVLQMVEIKDFFAYVNACPEGEGSEPLVQEHAKAVLRNAPGGFGLGKKAGFGWIVNGVKHGHVFMKVFFIKGCFIGSGMHACTRTVDQERTV